MVLKTTGTFASTTFMKTTTLSVIAPAIGDKALNLQEGVTEFTVQWQSFLACKLSSSGQVVKISIIFLLESTRCAGTF